MRNPTDIKLCILLSTMHTNRHQVEKRFLSQFRSVQLHSVDHTRDSSIHTDS